MIIMKKKNKKKTAVIYIRLSSKKQEKGMSRFEQERLCREYCEKHDIEIIGIYYENKSAMVPYARPEFMKMITFQKSDLRSDYVITMCVNRLTRNHVDLYPIEDIVNNYGTKLVFVRENLCLQKPIKASEGFLYDIIVANAKFEVKHMNEIRKEGLLARAKTGKRPCRAPYGYRKFNNSVVVVPEQAMIVKKIFEFYATGEFSLNEIPEILYSKQF